MVDWGMPKGPPFIPSSSKTLRLLTPLDVLSSTWI